MLKNARGRPLQSSYLMYFCTLDDAAGPVIIVETKPSLSNSLFNSKSRDGELFRFSSRYDDDLDEVEEEDHFEDVDDLEVSFLAIIF